MTFGMKSRKQFAISWVPLPYRISWSGEEKSYGKKEQGHNGDNKSTGVPAIDMDSTHLFIGSNFFECYRRCGSRFFLT
jgi:hypothetical protein